MLPGTSLGNPSSHQVSPSGDDDGDAVRRTIWRGLAYLGSLMLVIGGAKMLGDEGLWPRLAGMGLLAAGLPGAYVHTRRLIRATRAFWWSRQGRCTHCGYDFSRVLGGRCPECGRYPF